MACGDAVDKYVKLAMQCVRYIDHNKLTELLKPISDEKALIAQYREEVKSHREKGEQVMIPPEDFERECTNITPLMLIEKDLNCTFRGKPDKPTEKYYRLIKAQKGVMAHVKQCYKILYEDAKKQRKEQGNYNYLLAKGMDCEFR